MYRDIPSTSHWYLWWYHRESRPVGGMFHPQGDQRLKDILKVFFHPTSLISSFSFKQK